MAISHQQPAIVVVPGAWCQPKQYAKLQRGLEARGFDVHIPALPTCSNMHPPKGRYIDDVAAVRDTVEPLVEDDERDVVMIMHSYGGAVGSDALDGLTRSVRRGRGLKGGVTHLFYLAGYMLSEGWSVMKVMEQAGLVEHLPEVIEFAPDGSCRVKDPVNGLFADLSPAEQQEQRKLLTWASTKAFDAKTHFAAWKEVPTTYFFTTENVCVPPVYQVIMAEEAERWGFGFEECTLESGFGVYVKDADIIVDKVCQTVA